MAAVEYLKMETYENSFCVIGWIPTVTKRPNFAEGLRQSFFTKAMPKDESAKLFCYVVVD